MQNETKQKRCSNTKIFAFARELLRVQNDCSQKVSQFIAFCVVHSSLLAWISSLVYKDKVLAWLSFRKIHIAQSILRRKFPSNTKLADSETQISLRILNKPLRIKAPPKITPTKKVFEKCKHRGLFAEFYSVYVDNLS